MLEVGGWEWRRREGWKGRRRSGGPHPLLFFFFPTHYLRKGGGGWKVLMNDDITSGSPLLGFKTQEALGTDYLQFHFK